MGCDDAYGRFGSNSDARKRKAERSSGVADDRNDKQASCLSQAEFAVREDEWREDFPEPDWHKAKSDEYVPTVPSTSEYIRSLCQKNKDLEDAIRALADKYADWGSTPRTPPNRRGEQVYGNGRLDSYRTVAGELRALLNPDVSN